MATMAVSLQRDYPDVLYRVTSTMTYLGPNVKRVPIEPYRFQSPRTHKQGAPLDLLREFDGPRTFERNVQSHLLTDQRVTEAEVFDSPFISFTASFRFAVSVARIQADIQKERQEKRQNERWAQKEDDSIIITVIDCKSLQNPGPLYNAFELASKFGILGKKGFEEFRDEYLLFGTLERNQENSTSVRYRDIKLHLGYLMPALHNIPHNPKKRRFSDGLDDIPIETALPTSRDGDSAFRLATMIAPKPAILSVMTSLLLFQNRELANDPRLHNAISELVVDKAKVAESSILSHYTELMSIVADPAPLTVRDFLGPQYVPAQGTTTPETTDLCYCLLKLRRLLHTHQDCVVAGHLDGLLTPALMIQEFLELGGYYSATVKQSDGGDATPQNRSVNGSQELLGVFAGLQQAVQEAVDDLECTSPLLWLHECLKDASEAAKAASQLEGYDEVTHWTTFLQDAASSIKIPGQPRLPELCKQSYDSSQFRIAEDAIDSEEPAGRSICPILAVVKREILKPRLNRPRGLRGAPTAPKAIRRQTEEYYHYGTQYRRKTEVYEFGAVYRPGAR